MTLSWIRSWFRFKLLIWLSLTLNEILLIYHITHTIVTNIHTTITITNTIVTYLPIPLKIVPLVRKLVIHNWSRLTFRILRILSTNYGKGKKRLLIHLGVYHILLIILHTLAREKHWVSIHLRCLPLIIYTFSYIIST